MGIGPYVNIETVEVCTPQGDKHRFCTYEALTINGSKGRVMKGVLCNGTGPLPIVLGLRNEFWDYKGKLELDSVAINRSPLRGTLSPEDMGKVIEMWNNSSDPNVRSHANESGIALKVAA